MMIGDRALILLVLWSGYVQVHCDCSRSLPSYDESSFTGGNLTGGIQLLIPSWNFSCQGFINKWQAHVVGNTSITDFIEFQIYEPDSQQPGLYHSVYSNTYVTNLATVDGSMITLPITNLDNRIARIPAAVNSTIGIYIRPEAANLISLLYDDTNGVDVYYWDNVSEPSCDILICDGSTQVMNIRPLIGWTFQNVEMTFTQLLTAVEALRNNSPVCSEVQSVTCPELIETSSISSTISSTIVEGTSSSVMPPMTTSSYNSLSSSSTLTNTPSPSLSSSSVPPTITTAASTVPTGAATPQSDTLTLELIGALTIVGILIILVIVLAIAIFVCFCVRHKAPIQVTVIQGFDNPDYAGSISNGSAKYKTVDAEKGTGATELKTLQTSGSHPPLPSIPQEAIVQETSMTPPPLYSHIAEGGINIDTRGTRGLSPASSDKILSPDRPPSKHASPPLTEGEQLVYFTLEEHDQNRQHVLSPPPTELPPKPPADPVMSNVYDDPMAATNSDNIRAERRRAATIANPGGTDATVIYGYVPTEEQRRLLNWRYEVPMAGPYDKLRFFEEKSQFWAPALTAAGLYEQLSVNKYREIPREQIKVTRSIGEGQFGSVSMGAWTPPDGRHEVAVKMLKPDASDEARIKLLQEAAIMGQFSHKNVVRLEGVVTVGDPVLIVLEFLPRGDLRSYLRSIKQNTGHWKGPPQGLVNLLLKFCRNIASGMAYLSKKSFVHRDLAARNILLTGDLSCKIGDFGMARDLMSESNYYTSSGGIIPIKWTAPEAINFKKYTSASDVWSYGMVLYEIWSLGQKPFTDLSNPIVIALINSKHCQAPPPGCPRPIYHLMVDTWNPEHHSRPSFESIVNLLSAPDDKLNTWNDKDVLIGKKAHILGFPLDESVDLYVDLQRVYQNAMIEDSGRKRSQSHT